MPKRTPRKRLERFIESRETEENITLFCLIVPHKIPYWLSLFINQHETSGDLLKYPEFNKTLHQQTAFITNLIKENTGVRFIVTQSPWIISDFDRMATFIIEDSTVEVPMCQTFGASVNKITMTILGRTDTCGDRARTVLKAISRKIRRTNTVDGLYKILDEELLRPIGDCIEKTLISKTIHDKIDDLEGKSEKD